MAEAVAGLKNKKIDTKLETALGDPNRIFLMSIDSSHFRIEEPRVNGRTQPKYYSQKFRSAGLSYEVCCDVRDSSILWINGPFPAGSHDITIFRSENGLKSLLQMHVGKRLIGDLGYNGEPDFISTRQCQRFSSAAVKEFKRRAQSRQEHIFKHMKEYRVLGERFRHSEAKHKSATIATAVIIQYRMEDGERLFDL